VDRSANFNASLGRKTSRKPHHLGAVRLHREIAKRSGIGICTNMEVPTEYGVKRAPEHGVIDGSVGPLPKCPVSFAVRPQQIAGDYWRLSNPQSKGLSSHAVLHSQHALFEEFTSGLVGLLRCVLRDSAGLLGEC
jgi:hypothetical protein